MDMISRQQIDIEVEDWNPHNCPPLCDQHAKRPRPKPLVECWMLINQDLHSFARSSLCSRCLLGCLGFQVSHVSPKLKCGFSNDTIGLHMSCEQKNMAWRASNDFKTIFSKVRWPKLNNRIKVVFLAFGCDFFTFRCYTHAHSLASQPFSTDEGGHVGGLIFHSFTFRCFFFESPFIYI